MPSTFCKNFVQTLVLLPTSKSHYNASERVHRALSKPSWKEVELSQTPNPSCLSSPLTTASHRLDHDERVRKRTAREAHKLAKDSQTFTGLRAKLHQKKRHHEKIQMKKQIRQKEQSNVKSSGPSEPSSTPLPQYLLDRSQPTNAKALSSAIKNKRKEAAAKFSVPLPKVKGISEEEMFKVVKTGKKTAKKGW